MVTPISVPIAPGDLRFANGEQEAPEEKEKPCGKVPRVLARDMVVDLR
jgi:hypothetical protein